MEEEPFSPRLPPVPDAASAVQPPDPKLRVEYVGFQDVEEHRVFRFRIYGRDGTAAFRVRIARAAFDARRISIQDCPDLCYQVLLRAVAADLAALPELITIVDADLVSYREDHTPVLRRRAKPAGWAPKPAPVPRKAWQHRPSPKKTPPEQPALIVPADVTPAFAEGQRVSHAVFGLGVTMTTSSARTVVSFDEGGPRSFVTSMLELERLSAPGTWEIGRGGSNRPCRPSVG